MQLSALVSCQRCAAAGWIPLATPCGHYACTRCAGDGRGPQVCTCVVRWDGMGAARQGFERCNEQFVNCSSDPSREWLTAVNAGDEASAALHLEPMVESISVAKDAAQTSLCMLKHEETVKKAAVQSASERQEHLQNTKIPTILRQRWLKDLARKSACIVIILYRRFARVHGTSTTRCHLQYIPIRYRIGAACQRQSKHCERKSFNEDKSPTRFYLIEPTDVSTIRQNLTSCSRQTM
eukprot:SAG31_NODE_3183_length_4581_cov_1.629183_2_plen_237_part_00